MLEQSLPENERCCLLGCWASANPAQQPPVPPVISQKRKIRLLTGNSVHSSPNPWRNHSPLRLKWKPTSQEREALAPESQPQLLPKRSEDCHDRLTGSTRHSINVNLLRETRKPQIGARKRVVVHEAVLLPTRNIGALLLKSQQHQQSLQSPLKSTLYATTQVTGSPDAMSPPTQTVLRQFSSEIPLHRLGADLLSSCGLQFPSSNEGPRLAESRNYCDDADVPGLLVIPSHEQSESGWSMTDEMGRPAPKREFAFTDNQKEDEQSPCSSINNQMLLIIQGPHEDGRSKRTQTLPESQPPEERLQCFPPAVPRPRGSYQLSPLKETGNSSIEENQSDTPRVQPRIDLKDARTINSNDNSQRSNDDSEVIFRRSVGSTISSLRLRLFEQDTERRPRGSHRGPRPPPFAKPLQQFDMKECLTVLNRSVVVEEPPTQPISKTFMKGHFLGMGRFSTFYYARDRTSGFLTLIQEVDWASLQRRGLEKQLELQITIYKMAESPSVLPLYRTAAEDNKRFLIMEAGECTLATRLQGPRLLERQAVQYLRDILQGLALLHNLGLGHGNLTASKILLVCGRCKLFDFSYSEHSLSPEVDCEALGALACGLVSGRPDLPFEDLSSALDASTVTQLYREMALGLLERRLSAAQALACEIFH